MLEPARLGLLPSGLALRLAVTVVKRYDPLAREIHFCMISSVIGAGCGVFEAGQPENMNVPHQLNLQRQITLLLSDEQCPTTIGQELASARKYAESAQARDCS